MRYVTFFILNMVLGWTMLTTGLAQVRFSTPFTFIPQVSANVDDRGCRDFRCGSRTYCGHCGTDFRVVLGTEVYAAANGNVTDQVTGCPYGWATFDDSGHLIDCDRCGGGFGNFVKMQASLDGSWSFVVAHLSDVYVNIGDYSDCNTGPMLGRSGSSGCSSGPHTHFQVYHYGWCQGDDPYAGTCGGPESFWTCQQFNQDLCGNDCQ